MRRNGIGQQLFGVTAVVLALIGVSHPRVTRADQQSMTLRAGETRTAEFVVEDPQAEVLLWVRGRIVLPDGEQGGAHALELSLNGTPLTPQHVQVLNKKAVYDQPGAVGEHPRRAGVKIVAAPSAVALFAEAGGWYLKADADEFPFNAQGRPGDPYTSIRGDLPKVVSEPNLSLWLLQNRQALVSHYYEYLLALPKGLVGKQNTLTAKATLPDRLSTRNVELSFGPIKATHDVVTYHRPAVTEFTSLQQAPSLPDVLDDNKGLQLAACGGESEPGTVTLYALRPLQNVTVSVEPLQPDGGPGATIPASAVQCYYFAQRPDHQQPPGNFPFGEDAAANAAAPDVLVRIGEKPVGLGRPVNIPFVYKDDRKDQKKIDAAIARSKQLEETPGIPVEAMTSQRFLVDIKVPQDQAPGMYRGAVVLKDGQTQLRRLPFTLKVHPFKLLPPRQKYWMWRQTWTPVTEPANIASLRMLGDFGMNGVCRLSGLGVIPRFDRKTGQIVLDDSQLREGKQVLQDAGLEPTYATDLVSVPFNVICQNKYGIRPGNAEWFGYKVMPHLADTRLDEKKYKPRPRDPSDVEVAKLRELMPQIEKDVVELLKQMRAKYVEAGLDPRHFAYDEPDGTVWCHPWVKFSNKLAHEAGFQTWSSHNDPLGWPSGIDMSVAAGLPWHEPEVIHAQPFEGTMPYRGIPIMGQFKGRLDDISVYGRPLTDEEILAQHRTPAKAGRVAHYPLDEGQGNRAANADGNAALDLTLQGDPYARWVDGIKGRGLEFEYPNVGKGEIDQRTGQPASTRVGLIPSREVLKGQVPIPGQGWSISFWYSGEGVIMDAVHTVRVTTGGVGPKVDLRTAVPDQTTPARVIIPRDRLIQADNKFWNHITISVDPTQRVIKFYQHNPQQREWYQQNVKWVYSQYRGFNPLACRVQAGNTTWHARLLEHMTVFAFDLNYGVANLAWPEGGERFFNRPNTRWYPELGLMALREGIDDARYANTLFEQLKPKMGDQAAWEAVAKLYPGREIEWRKIYHQPAQQGVSFDTIRQRMAQEIESHAAGK